MKVRNKKVLVYGLGRSGLGAIELLKKQKAKIFVYDDNFEALNNLAINNVVKVESITENFLKGIDLIVLNPSVSIYCDNIKLATILNKPVISEIELAYYFAKGKIISITGSNGKSTTSTLIYNIFNLANKNCSLVGNIGNSFAGTVAKTKKQTFIVEVSSFQLETIQQYRSNTACFLNFSENHLDRHFSLKNYFQTKTKIFLNSKSKDYKILGYDDEKVKLIKPDKNTYYFSLNKVVKGTYIKDDFVCFNNGKKEEKILHIENIKLFGQHNLLNVLCAVLCAKLNNVSNENILKAVSSFYGINHRIEFVDCVNNVSFYNDSKSTTVKATQTALECFKDNNVLLILGGSDKGFEFTELFARFNKNVKYIIAIGAVREKILKEAKKFEFSNIIAFDDFDLAIKNAYYLARENNINIILFSPATASYDMFTNFEERGNRFKNLVKEIKSES